MCAPLNSFLPTWRKRAAGGLLGQFGIQGRHQFQEPPGVGAADQPARRRTGPGTCLQLPGSEAAQAEFIRQRLRADNLYPLLWNSQP